MSNNKQSSIDKFIEAIMKHDKSFKEFYRAEIEELKAMHKEEIINFGNDLLAQNDNNYIGMPNLAEQYYNERQAKQSIVKKDLGYWTMTNNKNMKKVLLATLLIGMVSSCEEATTTAQSTQHSVKIGVSATKLKVVEIEGCEYFMGDYDRSAMFTHKGNCKNPIHKGGNNEQL